MTNYFPKEGIAETKKEAPALVKVLRKAAGIASRLLYTASIPLTKLKHTEIPVDPRARNTIVEEPRGFIPR